MRNSLDQVTFGEQLLSQGFKESATIGIQIINWTLEKGGSGVDSFDRFRD
jgi:hypothetical protein